MLATLGHLVRRLGLPVWTLWMIASAILFLLGSVAIGSSGSSDLAGVGVVGALAAVAVLILSSE